MGVCTPITGVTLTQLTTGNIYPDTNIQISADIAPDNTAKPYTYTVDYSDGAPTVTSSSADPLALSYTWTSTGTYTTQVAVWNCDMTTPQTDTIPINVIERAFNIYLPLVLRQ